MPRWSDTQAGRAEKWVRALIFQNRRTPDYDDAVGFMGAEKAVKMMHNFYDEQFCSNHAPSAR